MGLKVPTGQNGQEVEKVGLLDAMVPTGHFAHEPDEGNKYEPGSQATHAMAPKAYFPASHWLHKGDPAVLVRNPEGQSWQVAAPGVENVPGGQRKQVVEPVWLAYRPESHG